MGITNDIRDELKDISPGFPEKQPIEPPSGYFESFPDQVLNRWSREQSQLLPKTMIWRRIAGVAAVITGLCLLGWLYFTNTSSALHKTISAAEAYQYVHENIEDFESLIDTEDAESIDVPLDISKEEIEEYLMEQTDGTDPEEIF